MELTLAALEIQTYPRELFEVVIVDDGSRLPLTEPEHSPLDVRVVHQEDLGFGLARARNTGVRAASNDIIVFLDCDMVPEYSQLHERLYRVSRIARTHQWLPQPGLEARISSAFDRLLVEPHVSSLRPTLRQPQAFVASHLLLGAANAHKAEALALMLRPAGGNFHNNEGGAIEFHLVNFDFERGLDGVSAHFNHQRINASTR